MCSTTTRRPTAASSPCSRTRWVCQGSSASPPFPSLRGSGPAPPFSGTCLRSLLALFPPQMITVYSLPGMDPDWLIGERGNQKGRVPVTYLELLS